MRVERSERVNPKVKQLSRTSERLCAKASGAILSQASEHDADHGDVDPGFFTAGKHFVVFGEPAPRGKPSEIEYLPINKTL
jgi:hypothetical protein